MDSLLLAVYKREEPEASTLALSHKIISLLSFFLCSPIIFRHLCCSLSFVSPPLSSYLDFETRRFSVSKGFLCSHNFSLSVFQIHQKGVLALAHSRRWTEQTRGGLSVVGDVYISSCFYDYSLQEVFV
ncbi:Uncharacterized protein Rs2_24060 [Raphanus sativus]|nr:Uncharacterized protein Rs2_24060 [Raphanus sativus]